MSRFEEDPAVLTWRLALAPRPRYRVGRHWWRDLVTDTHFWATVQWESTREAVALGYRTEMREFEEANPRPRLGDAMRHLSNGAIDMHDLSDRRSVAAM